MVKSAVFLDRDGIINANVEREGKFVAPTRLEDFRLLPGVEEAVRRLKDAGYIVIVCTNQPDVGTGLTSRATVEAMHDLIRSTLEIDDIKSCFHTDEEGCNCRKPKPGMILDAAREFPIDLTTSYMIGDRWKDIVAGSAAGCLTIFVDYGYAQDGPDKPDHIVASLSEAAAFILSRTNASQPSDTSRMGRS